MRLYNSLTRQIEEIKPIKAGEISMYNCGPTVYWKMHVGNLRAYAAWDILHRSLLYLGYDVKRFVNFTDVGHMSNDSDFGDDKMEKSATKEGKDPLDIANHYIRTVLNDFSRMNYLNPDGTVVDPNMDIKDVSKHGWLRATDHIQEIIDFNKKIEENGFTYETDLALYFDVSKYSDYSRLSGQDLNQKLVGVRDEVNVDSGKKNPADFVLWMKNVGKYENHLMSWDSPWGVGFPGWHIECSAMGCKHLGDHFDIHTGGIDHIPVHHSNERAQNYGAFGKEVVNYWIHNEFINASTGEKLSKSLGNAVDLDEIINDGFTPMELRYHLISINYRVSLKINREALDGSKKSLQALLKRIREVYEKAEGVEGKTIEEYVSKFKNALEDNLNLSEAFAILNELLKSDKNPADIIGTVFDYDKVLALNIKETVSKQEEEIIPDEIKEILKNREEARKNKDYAKSDELRDKIASLGYKVLDTSEGQTLEKI